MRICRFTRWLAVWTSLGCLLGLAGNAAAEDVPASTPLAGLSSQTDASKLEKRWLLVRGNLLLDDWLEEAISLLSRAERADYNGVVISDTKLNNWFTAEFEDRYEANVNRLRTHAESLGLEFVLTVLPYGYCGPVLSHDPSLAAAIPVVDAPLEVTDGQLVALETSSVLNGSFEDYTNNTLSDWFQDDAGQVSFIDTDTVKDGSASLRVENFSANDNSLGRVIQRLEVLPFQQYRLNVWLKMETLSAARAGVTILATKDEQGADIEQDARRNLLTQNISLPQAQGAARELRQVTGESLDWTRVSFVFNSLDNTEIALGMGVYGGAGGRLWLDGVTLESVPTLNVLRRDDLALTVSADGVNYSEGEDFTPVVDPLLGTVPFGGKYDLYHDAPLPLLTPGTSLSEGQRVLYSGYHPKVVTGAHVACSLADPALDVLADRIVREVETAYAPDAYFLGFSELRSGGWEVRDQAYGSSAAWLADNVRRTYALTRAGSADKPVYMWADMLDPHHNARTNYYQVAGDMTGAGDDLPPALTLITWWEGDKITTRGRASLEYFARQGHAQIIGAFYDEDIETNRASWQAAAAGVPNIKGAMYATWTDDYSQLERFAEVWWGGEE